MSLMSKFHILGESKTDLTLFNSPVPDDYLMHSCFATSLYMCPCPIILKYLFFLLSDIYMCTISFLIAISSLSKSLISQSVCYFVALIAVISTISGVINNVQTRGVLDLVDTATMHHR